MEYFLIPLIALVVLLAVGGAMLNAGRGRRKEPFLEPPAESTEFSSRVDTSKSVDVADLTPEQVAEIERTLEGVGQPDATEALLESVGPAVEAGVEPALERPRFRDRLGKTRGLLGEYLGLVRKHDKIDQTTWDELEEGLIRADVGVATTTKLLDDLKARVKSEGINTSTELLESLKSDLKKQLASADRSLRLEDGGPNVWLFVGVNGVGKTTTIGKVGLRYAQDGKSILMAAGDTFRAAAAEQLTVWAERAGAEIVRGQEGGDPGAVIYDAIERAAARDVDLVLADTAGRLHTKFNLMEELKKVHRIAEREPAKLTEVLLVLDATTGQNGLAQARQFSEAAKCTGVVLTKLDGSAKGGIALAIETDLGIPIKLVGLGETAVDLIDFDADEFVDALFE